MNGTDAVPDAELDAPAPPAPKPSRVWLQVFLGLAILGCGMVIGAGATVLVGRRMFSPPSRHPAQISRAITRHLSGRLDLTPQQQQQVRDIIRQHIERVNDIRNQSRRDAESELNQMRDDVAKVLTPDQARAWRQEYERLRRLRPPPPPGGPVPPFGGPPHDGPPHGHP